MLKTLALMALMGLTTCTGFAGTVTYTLTATATGSLDGTAFSDSLLTITAVANTAAPGSPFSSTAVVDSLTDTFNAESPYVFVNSGDCTGSPEFPTVSSCAGFGTSADILDIANNAFATYVLGTSVGPLTDPMPFGNLGDSFVDDSGGDLILTSLSDGSFTAVSAVPEPPSVAFVGIALIAAGIASRHRLVAGRYLK
jgi:hypothetical protein